MNKRISVVVLLVMVTVGAVMWWWDRDPDSAAPMSMRCECVAAKESPDADPSSVSPAEDVDPSAAASEISSPGLSEAQGALPVSQDQGDAGEEQSMQGDQESGQLSKAPADLLEGIRALERQGPDSVDALVQIMAEDPNSILRVEAVMALARLSGQEGLSAEASERVMSALLGGLSNSYPVVIMTTAESLSGVGTSPVVDALLEALGANERRPDGYGMPIRTAIVGALGACGDARVTPALMAELTRHEDLSYDNALVLAIDGVGDPAALDALKAHLQRLQGRRPDEPMALESWKEAVVLAETCIEKLATLQAK